MLIGPQIQNLTREFTPIVTPSRFRRWPVFHNMIQHRHHLFASQTRTGFNRQTFSRQYIEDRQGSEAAAIGQLIGHKI